MRVICAWCQKEMGEKEPKGDRSVTHGICDLCQATIAEEVKQWEEENDRISTDRTLSLN